MLSAATPAATPLPPRHRLAFNEPGLFFTLADLPALRAKLAHPDCAATWQRLLAACEQMLLPTPPPLYPRHIRAEHLAFASLITGRDDFAEGALVMARTTARNPQWGGSKFANKVGARTCLATGACTANLTLVRDWLAPRLGTEDRALFAGAVKEQAFDAMLHDLRTGVKSTSWYVCNGMAVTNAPILMAALRFADELDTREIEAGVLTQVRRNIGAFCPDGGYTEGLLYWNYFFRHLLLGIVPLARLRGIDLTTEPFVRGTGDYPLHFIHPWLTDCTNTADSTSLTHLWAGMAFCAAHYRRPDWQWLARRMVRHDWGLDGESLEYSLFFLLYYDPELPATPPLPEQRYWLFGGLQQLSWRSDWTPDARHLVWLNGPANVHHNHLHLNSFTLAAYGRRLLVELGQHDYSNHDDGRFSTTGHNTLRVNGEDQAITTDTDQWCRRVRPGQWGPTYGLFEGWREEAGAMLATGVVHGAYPGRLSEFARTLVWLGDQAILLHDQLAITATPPVALQWRFHAGGDWHLTPEGGEITYDHARLALRWLAAADYTWQVIQEPPERCHPERPVPCLLIECQVSTPTHDAFALLLPWHAGTPPPAATLARQPDGLIAVALAGIGAWHYDPSRRKLLAAAN
jgi:hypothetical protein